MKIAVEGCAHGDLDIIYDTIEYIEKQNDIHIDLLLCCGDFQPSRNLQDVKCMAAPEKYLKLCTFYKYYSGEKTAPKLTIFIGGNHEASNYLQELPYGGWVAPNIYYMGYAGVINIAGIRIAGLSGIFNDGHFALGRYEKPPYNAESIRSCYHVRNLEIFRLKQLTSPLHVVMTHDWPQGIAYHGNLDQLLRFKPHLKEDIETNQLGNPAAIDLLKLLKPDYWFAAHLHVKFAALYRHDNSNDGKVTKFLALNKCLPRKRFLQVLDIPHQGEKPFQLEYDLEWLTILHSTNHLISVKKLNNYMPGPGSDERWNFTPTKEEMETVLTKFNNDLVIPQNFHPTAPPHGINSSNEHPTTIMVNPQTVNFCNRLCVDDPMDLLQKQDGFTRLSFTQNASRFESSSFIGLTDSEADVSTTPNKSHASTSFRTPLKLPTPKIQSDLSDPLLTSTPVSKPDLGKNKCPASNIDSDSDGPRPPKDPKGEEIPSDTPKPFRRRNVAIYSNDDDNE